MMRVGWDFGPWQGVALPAPISTCSHLPRHWRSWAFRPRWPGLAGLARGGRLTGVSQAAYGDGLTGLARVDPLGEVPGVSKLVQVQVLDVVTRVSPPCSR
jgi:hypothetical protein